MHDTAKPTLRVICGGRTDHDGRLSVDLYRHDTREVHPVVLTLPQLLAAIRRRRPQRPGDSEWTFSIGRRRSLSLSITTEGPGKFWAQRAVKETDDLVAELTEFNDLTPKDVERLVHEFYADGGYDLPRHSRG
jgi:hypothetical protein